MHACLIISFFREEEAKLCFEGNQLERACRHWKKILLPAAASGANRLTQSLCLPKVRTPPKKELGVICTVFAKS